MTTSAPPVATAARPSRPLWRRVLGPLLSVALIVAVFAWFLPQFTSVADVWSSARQMTWTEVALLGAAALWNLATYQFLVVATMPGLTLGQATVSTQTSTAVSNTVLGGSAISLGITYAMNSSWGFSRSRTSVMLLVSGLWNNFAKLGLPVFALALLAFSGPPSATWTIAGLSAVAALVAVVVALGLLLRSPAGAARIGTGAPGRSPRCAGSSGAAR